MLTDRSNNQEMLNASNSKHQFKKSIKGTGLTSDRI